MVAFLNQAERDREPWPTGMADAGRRLHLVLALDEDGLDVAAIRRRI